jgi:hypothetical protein
MRARNQKLVVLKSNVGKKRTMQEDKTIEVQIFELYIPRARDDWNQKKQPCRLGSPSVQSE